LGQEALQVIEPYMLYIETGLEIDQKGNIRKKAPSGAGKYHGDVAGGYDAKREESPKWQAEQTIIEGMLSNMPSGHWILDVPCGTGRFFKFYAEMGYCFRGMDMSADMLAIAGQKVVDQDKARLMQGDVRKLKLGDKSVDASVMVRLTRWLSPEDCQVAFKELQRVTRDRIILTTRITHQKPELSRPVELFLDALGDEWSLTENAEGAEPDYRILMFKRAQ